MTDKPVGIERFWRYVALVAGGSALAQIIQIAITPIVTRLYAPEQFGVLASFAAILAIVLVVCTFRFELAIPVAENQDEARRIVALCFFVLAGVTGIAALIVGVAGKELLVMAGIVELGDYLWLLPVGLLAAGLFQIASYWFIRSRLYAELAAIRIGQSVLAAGVQIGAGVLAPSAGALISGHIVGQSSGIFRLFFGKHRWLKPRSFNWSDLTALAKKHRAFAVYSAPGALMNTVALQAVPIFFLAAYDAKAAGLMALAQKMVAMPTNLLSQSIGQVYLGEYAVLARSDPRALLKASTRLAAVLGGVALLFWAAVFFFGERLFGLVFGSVWEQAGSFCAILVTAYAVQLVVNPIAQLNILERQDLFLWWNSIRLALVGAAFWYAEEFNVEAFDAAKIYTAAMTASYLLMVGLWLYAILNAIKRQPKT